jgi:methyl-accepting chemotaxis protein
MKSLNRATSLALAGILATVAIGGLSALWASHQQTTALHRMQQASELLRNHMAADMAHDAVHADVLELATGVGGPPAEVSQDLEGHSAILSQMVRADMAYPDSPAVSAAARKISDAVDGYIAAANRIAETAAHDRAATRAAMPDFMRRFHFLEGGMDKVSDAITDHVGQVKADAAQIGQRAISIMILVLVASVLSVLAAAYSCRRWLVQPLVALAGAVGRIAQGDLAVTLADGRRDEIGRLSAAVTDLRDPLVDAEAAKGVQEQLIVSSVGAGLAALAQGDLTSRIEAELPGAFAALKQDFNATAIALHRTIATVASSVTNIRTGAYEISEASNDLSQRTERQAATLEETAAALDQITASMQTAAAGAAKADAAAAAMRADAERGEAVVREAVAAMTGIERASQEISDIITVIDGIAFQTNLLALNAGVEAARAGDAGKGFAVVAAEVRALAQRSADAARDVKARINASAEQVGAGVELVGRTGEALHHMIDRMQEVGGLVAEIATAADLQAGGLRQVNSAIAEMDSVTQQNAAMVEQATAASRSLSAEAHALDDQILAFDVAADPTQHRSLRVAA